MKPKIVSVKALQARRLPPPSEEEYEFVERNPPLAVEAPGSKSFPQPASIGQAKPERKGLFSQIIWKLFRR